jgi:prepilin-type N-terminal cleavage/methylation domain-containing protein
MLSAIQHDEWRSSRRSCSAFTLVELVVAVAIAGLGIAGIVWGYAMASQRTEWTAASSAAQLMALRHLETTRGARWDLLASPPVDELVTTNFPERVELLAVPQAGGPGIAATNYTTIREISFDPPLRLVRVDCVWSVLQRGPFTNTVMTYRGTD